MFDFEHIPLGCDCGRVNHQVGVEINNKRGEGLREGIDEGRIVERRS